MTKQFRRVSLFTLSLLLCFVVQNGLVLAKDHKAAAEKIRSLNGQIVAANEKHDLPGAIQAAEEAVQVAKAEYGKKSLEAANSMNNLANLYVFADRAPEAEQLFKKAILIDLDKLDNRSTDMADIYFNLGVAYAVQKKYTDAIKIVNKALSIRQEKLGPDHAATKKAGQMIDELTKIVYPKTEKI